MNLVVIDIDQLKTIINDAVTTALKQHSAPEQPDTLMRKDEVSQELKVSLKTITVWMREGKIPYHKIKSRVFFKRSEILEAMQIPLKYKRK